MKIIANSEIDRIKWDEVIKCATHKNPYGYTYFLDSLFPDWKCIIINDYEIVIPIIQKNTLGITRLIQPLFCQQFGLYSRKEINPTVVNSILDFLSKKYQHANFCWNIAHIDRQGISHKRRNLTLNLNNQYHSLAQGYSNNNMRNIKKFHKSQLSIEKITRESGAFEIIELFKENKAKSLSLPSDFYGKLHEFLSVFKNNLKIYQIRDKGKILSGVIFLNIENFFILLFSASNSAAKKMGASHAIIDQFIKDHSSHDSILDFEGSDNDNLSRFYQGFGAKESIYLQINWNNLPIPLKWIKK